MMTPLVRLWEILSGSPHIRRNSELVRKATNELTVTTQELMSAIKPYSESDDPLTSFMVDLYERRRNAQSQLHS